MSLWKCVWTSSGNGWVFNLRVAYQMAIFLRINTSNFAEGSYLCWPEIKMAMTAIDLDFVSEGAIWWCPQFVIMKELRRKISALQFTYDLCFVLLTFYLISLGNSLMICVVLVWNPNVPTECHQFWTHQGKFVFECPKLGYHWCDYCPPKFFKK